MSYTLADGELLPAHPVRDATVAIRELGPTDYTACWRAMRDFTDARGCGDARWAAVCAHLSSVLAGVD